MEQMNQDMPLKQNDISTGEGLMGPHVKNNHIWTQITFTNM